MFLIPFHTCLKMRIQRFLSYDNREREAFYDGNTCKQKKIVFHDEHQSSIAHPPCVAAVIVIIFTR